MKKRKSGGFSEIRPGEDLSEDDAGVIEIKTEMVYNWVSQVLLALTFMHSIGVVHRDVKPASLQGSDEC